MSTKLIKYDAARRALAEAKAVDEVKDIRDKAMAMKLYAKLAGDHQLENDAVTIRLRAERRLGEMMKQQAATVGTAKASGSNQHKERVSKKPEAPPTLDEAGIDKNLAHRARKLAAMPAAKFEEMVKDVRNGATKPNGNGELTAKHEREVEKLRSEVARLTEALETERRYGKNVEQGRYDDFLSAQHLRGLLEYMAKQDRLLSGQEKLPDDLTKRYRAILTKYRNRDRAKLAALEGHNERIRGAFKVFSSDQMWNDLLLCTYPNPEQAAGVDTRRRVYEALMKIEPIVRPKPAAARNGQQA